MEYSGLIVFVGIKGLFRVAGIICDFWDFPMFGCWEYGTLGFVGSIGEYRD